MPFHLCSVIRNPFVSYFEFPSTQMANIPPSDGRLPVTKSVYGITLHRLISYSESDFPEVAEGPDYGGHGAICDGDGEV